MDKKIVSEEKSKAPKLKGVVMSAKMEKTLVVAVDTLKRHPKYLKQYRSTKRYKVHVPDEAKKYQAGDTVMFRECRPISKEKRHVLIPE